MNEHAIRKILEGGGGWPGWLLRGCLWFPGVCYGGLMDFRRMAYQRGWLEVRKASVPVISVGNLTAGGSGKTPLVAMLAKRLSAAGRKPGVLLRGYRKSADGISDEAVQYGDLCPGVVVEVGSDRSVSAKRAIAAGADVLIMDDGFQHLRLKRDLDIVLVDATSPWGGGNTFPGGLLREPKTALTKAGAVVITRSDQVDQAVIERIRSEIAFLAPLVPVFTARHKPVRLRRLDGIDLPLAKLQKRNVLALSGIARPEAFVRTLSDLGARVVGLVAGRDHDAFCKGFVDKAVAHAHDANLVVITTEKDKQKKIFTQLADNTNVWSLGVDQDVDGEDSLMGLVKDALSGNGPDF